jgi:hypothetical protein
MALRPRLSTGLPLSNKMVERFKENEPGKTRLAKYGLFFLRRPGSPGHKDVTVDPWLCAPAFRRVCLFGFIFWHYSKGLYVFTFHFSNTNLQLCNEQNPCFSN